MGRIGRIQSVRTWNVTRITVREQDDARTTRDGGLRPGTVAQYVHPLVLGERAPCVIATVGDGIGSPVREGGVVAVRRGNLIGRIARTPTKEVTVHVGGRAVLAGGSAQVIPLVVGKLPIRGGRATDILQVAGREGYFTAQDVNGERVRCHHNMSGYLQDGRLTGVGEADIHRRIHKTGRHVYAYGFTADAAVAGSRDGEP